MFSILKSLFSKRDNDQLKTALTKHAFLVDVRSQEEFSSGSIDGAVNIPLNSLSANLEQLREKDCIVVFCRSGGRSALAKATLDKNGFQNIIDGGSWQNVIAAKQAEH